MADFLGNPSLLIVFGLVATFVTSALKNPDWPHWAKQTLTFTVSGTFGLLAVYLRHANAGTPITGDLVLAYVAESVTIAQTAYWLLLRTGENGVTPAQALNQRLTKMGAGRTVLGNTGPEG